MEDDKNPDDRSEEKPSCYENSTVHERIHCSSEKGEKPKHANKLPVDSSPR
jgi:hypothetical protein